MMIQVGIEPHAAVATNMLTLTILSLGGAMPFVTGTAIPRERLPAMIGFTLIGSVLGAVLMVVTAAKAIPMVIALAMLDVVAFSLIKSNAGVSSASTPPGRNQLIGGHALILILGIYGGFFSGGYVTLLTAVMVNCFGMTFLEAVIATKLLNLVSSLVATAVFAQQGLIDWTLGLVLGVVSFSGAAAGGAVARKLSNRLLRRLFLAAVFLLAVKTLLYDLQW
jgi:uncharacterized membrane protein YfcA